MDWYKLFMVSNVVLGAVFIGGIWALKKEFVRKAAFDNHSERLQTIEQTYVKDDEFRPMQEKLNAVANETRGLPEEVRQLQKQNVKLATEVAHLTDTIKRVERPLNLLIESKIMRESDK